MANSQSPEDFAVSRFRLRLAMMLTLRQALAALALWAFLWGTAVLALRGALETPRRPLLWGLAGAPLAVLAAYFLARRKFPANSALRATLDRQGKCGLGRLIGRRVGDGDRDRIGTRRRGRAREHAGRR